MFDEQGKIGVKSRDWYYKIKDIAAPELLSRLGGEPTFKHDKNFLALKSADMLAWHLRRHYNEEQIHPLPYADKLNESLMMSMTSLLAMPGISCNIQVDDLEQLVKTSGKPMFQAHCGLFFPSDDSTVKP